MRVHSVRIFGSVARGDDESDIHLPVDFDIARGIRVEECFKRGRIVMSRRNDLQFLEDIVERTEAAKIAEKFLAESDGGLLRTSFDVF